MSAVMAAVRGVVKNGKVELESPLPEGTQIECQTVDPVYGMPLEFWDDLRGWQIASANALEMVEQLAQEMENNETR